MLKDTDRVSVENRGNAIVCYRIPETNFIRRFVANERKDILMSELRAAVQIPGTFAVIEDNLIIHNKEAAAELFPHAEPEYFYTANDVEYLLTQGSLDQLRDALDFAPEGVISLIQDTAIKIKLNDMNKREVIKEQTGFDITKILEFKKMGEIEEVKPETKMRRTATPSTPEQTSEMARRTPAFKLKSE